MDLQALLAWTKDTPEENSDNLQYGDSSSGGYVASIIPQASCVVSGTGQTSGQKLLTDYLSKICIVLQETLPIYWETISGPLLTQPQGLTQPCAENLHKRLSISAHMMDRIFQSFNQQVVDILDPLATSGQLQNCMQVAVKVRNVIIGQTHSTSYKIEIRMKKKARLRNCTYRHRYNIYYIYYVGRRLTHVLFSGPFSQESFIMMFY